MVQHAVSNQKKKKHAVRYDDCQKTVALYMYSIAGRSAYESFEANMAGSLPSVRTVTRTLSENESLIEGRFRFEEIKRAMTERGEELYVHCCEDDTKITERLRYNAANDEILGLQLPLDKDGKPICGSFKFTSFSAVQQFVAKSPKTSYAKLMDMFEFTLRFKKFAVIEDAPQAIKDFHLLRSKKAKELLIPTELFTDSEIEAILQEGFVSATKMFAPFSKFTGKSFWTELMENLLFI